MKLLISLLALVAGCTYPDPRFSRVMPDNDIAVSTRKAIEFWEQAAPTLDVKIGNYCDSAEFQCVTVRYGQLKAPLQGITRRHYEPTTVGNATRESDITVSEDIRDDDKRTTVVMIHEMGHALGLNHVDSVKEIMFKNSLTACIGPETSMAWYSMYGEQLNQGCF